MSVTRGRDLSGDLRLDVDAVVVGTGAGGAATLRALARAGLSCAALEEGGFHTPPDFTQREDEMFPLLFQEGGGRATSDLAIRVLQGRGVGGSTVHNTNLCKRTPPEILDLWARRHHVSGMGARDLEAAFATIEKDLAVTEIPEALVNANNEALRRGATALGWRNAALSHNRVGCQASGFCELGCAYDAKQNAVKVLIPQAVSAGARVFSDARVLRVTTKGGRATGVVGHVLDDRGRPKAAIEVKAKVVVLAASAIGSAWLARRSGLTDPHAQAGRGLRMHPGAVVAGRFREPVHGHRGIPQSWECTEWLSFEEGSPRRTWIVPAFAHPIGTASALPGFGREHMARMRDYTRLAVLTAMLHDETSGVVEAEETRPVLHYRMIEDDRAALARGLVACARILFAAGAIDVTFPAIPPVTVRSPRELDALDTSFIRPHGTPLSAVHPMGTLRMGDDPRTSVVSSRGEHHHVRGLFVADGSLFPTSLGGPPQISIYAFAHHLAQHVIEAARR